MPNYICSKCELTAYSKNVRTRSIFSDNKMSSMYSNLINIETTKKKNGLRQVTLTIPYLEHSDEEDKRPDEALELDAFKLVQEIEPEALKYLVCSHDWDLVPGTGTEL